MKSSLDNVAKISQAFSGHITVHEDEMAQAPRHHEQMEHLMGAELPVPGIEQGELQGVDDPAHGIDDATCQQPQEGRRGQGVEEPAEHQHADPAHGDVDRRGEPFGTGDPEGLDQHPRQGDAPDQSQQGISQLPAQHDQADRRIGSGNQHEDHHMVQLAEDAQIPPGQIHRVVSGAGAVEQYHAGHEDGHGDEMLPS